MKQALIGLVLSVLFAACTVAQPMPTSVPAHAATSASIAQLPTTEPTSLPPTETPTQLPSATITQTFPTVTSTFTVTPTPSATPTLTATLFPKTASTQPPGVINDLALPQLTGKIYFLWDPNLIPEERGIGEQQNNNFYEIDLESISNDWYIEPTVEMLGHPNMHLSPDSTKLAILSPQDINGDGFVYSYNGPEPADIFLYSVVDKSLTQLTENQWMPSDINWLPDSQRISYSQLNELLLIEVSTPFSPENLYTFDGNIYHQAWSSDGKYLNVVHSSGGNPPDSTKLDIFQLETNQWLTLVDNVSPDLATIWSPISQWYVLTRPFTNQGLSIVNAGTHEIIELIPLDSHASPAWSPNESLLAFTNRTNLSLFDTNSLEIKIPLAMDYLISPSWSEDGNEIAMGFVEGEQSGIVILNPFNGDQKKLNIGMTAYQITWSPDKEWFLIFTQMNDKAGLYLIHKDSATTILLLDTTNTMPPYDIYWLSEK